MPTICNSIKSDSILPYTHKEIQKQTVTSELSKNINKATKSTKSKKLENMGIKSAGGFLCGLAIWPAIGVAVSILLTPVLPPAPLFLVIVGSLFVCGAIGGCAGAGAAITQDYLPKDEC